VPAPSEIGAIRPVLRTEDAGVERTERALVRPERTVRLRVATTGAPLPATAGVAVVDATSSVPLAWSPIAADGTVVIDRLPIGEHTVVLAPSPRHVRTEWFARASLPRNADAGNESDARIETTLQSVAVTLTLGSDGAPSPSTLASAVIVLTRADAPGWRRSLSMAGLDNDGRTVRVDLGVLAAGRYEVALHCADVLGEPREPNAITVPGPAEHTFTIASR
jgi:hypothetical protein